MMGREVRVVILWAKNIQKRDEESLKNVMLLRLNFDDVEPPKILWSYFFYAFDYIIFSSSRDDKTRIFCFIIIIFFYRFDWEIDEMKDVEFGRMKIYTFFCFCLISFYCNST